MKTLEIAKDFTRYPAGRNRSDGPYSGQAFREDHLEPLLKEGEPFCVVLDGARGYGSSFLEEAFGGLVRSGFAQKTINDCINIQSKDPSLEPEIRSYVKDAASLVA